MIIGQLYLFFREVFAASSDCALNGGPSRGLQAEAGEHAYHACSEKCSSLLDMICSLLLPVILQIWG